MTNKLIEVPFHGDIIEAVQDEKGDIYIPLLRPCDNLGMDYSAQLKRLKTKKWAVMAMIAITASDGKTYETTCLHLDGLPMWLATIDANRVKVSIRPKLELYQRDAKKVLADHFLGGRRTEASALAEIVNTFRQMGELLTGLVDRVTRLERSAPVVPHGFETGAWFGITDYTREKWPQSTGRQRNTILVRVKAECLRNGIACFPPVKGSVYVLDRAHKAMVNDVIDAVRREVQDSQKPETFPLFDGVEAAN